MKSRIPLSIVTALLLAGCAIVGASAAIQTQSKESQRARACHDTVCEISVKVEGCAVEVHPYFLVMVPQPSKEGPGFHPITVKWTVDKGTFAAKDAIRWKDPGASRVFTAPTLGPDKKTVSFSNAGTRGVYHYGVRVIGANGQVCPELDPTGINDPP